MSKVLITLLTVGLIASTFFMFQTPAQAPETAKTSVQQFHEYLNEITEQINSQDLTWKAKTYTRWANMDFESIARMNGALELTEEQKSKQEFWVPTVARVSNAIPASFDARTQWPGCSSIGEIRDQANCGSCWAFGAAEAITDRICIFSNQTVNPRISMENILTCCGSCGYGCSGGYPIQAWRYWASTGVVSGDAMVDTQWCQPYFLPACGESCPSVEGVAPACSTSCNAQSGITYANNITTGASAYAVAANVAAIQTEIMTNGPVEATFTVYADFYQYTSGVYIHKTGAQLGGHAVKIIGWGVTSTGTPYWTVANSWNTQWGMDGYFEILRGANECGIEQGVTAGLPK